MVGMSITSPNPNGIGSNGGHSGKAFGAGGKATLNSFGLAGREYGGGGGGSITGASTVAYSGGAGAPGIVIVTEYCSA